MPSRTRRRIPSSCTAQPEQEKHSFAEYRIRARQRGREVMQAVAEEFPEITLMTYRLFCDLLPVLDSGAPADALEPSEYGLQPAFVDGWCDVMPPTVRIVEGDEDGYRFNSEADFNRAYTRLRTRLPAFVSPGEPRQVPQPTADRPRDLPGRPHQPADFAVVHRPAWAARRPSD